MRGFVDKMETLLLQRSFLLNELMKLYTVSSPVVAPLHTSWLILLMQALLVVMTVITKLFPGIQL